MSGAIASSSSVFLALVASSSPRSGLRSRVGAAAIRSSGYITVVGAELRLHYCARRGPCRDGAALVRAAPAPAEGDGVVAPSGSSKSKGVAVKGSEVNVDSLTLATWHSNYLYFLLVFGDCSRTLHVRMGD
jgi:starch synthase